jgi:hypothetical protein
MKQRKSRIGCKLRQKLHDICTVYYATQFGRQGFCDPCTTRSLNRPLLRFSQIIKLWVGQLRFRTETFNSEGKYQRNYTRQKSRMGICYTSEYLHVFITLKWPRPLKEWGVIIKKYLCCLLAFNMRQSFHLCSRMKEMNSSFVNEWESLCKQINETEKQVRFSDYFWPSDSWWQESWMRFLNVEYKHFVTGVSASFRSSLKFLQKQTKAYCNQFTGTTEQTPNNQILCLFRIHYINVCNLFK